MFATPEVRAAHTALKDAEKAFNKHMRQYQEACPHPQVLECAWETGGWQAQRVCRCCGFHEYGGYGSATTKNSGEWASTNGMGYGRWYGDKSNTKLTTEFAKPASREEVSKYITQVKE